MNLELVTAAIAQPVSNADVKLFLRIDNTADDALIDSLISVSTTLCEDYTNRSFIKRTYRLWLDHFPACKVFPSNTPWWDGTMDGPISLLQRSQEYIEIPRAPLFAVTSLSTFDLNDVETVFDSANYLNDLTNIPGRVVLKYGQTWPVALRVANAVKILFDAGYGLSATQVPEPIKHAIKITCAYLYENREASGDLPSAAKILLNNYRVQKL